MIAADQAPNCCTQYRRPVADVAEHAPIIEYGPRMFARCPDEAIQPATTAEVLPYPDATFSAQAENPPANLLW